MYLNKFEIVYFKSRAKNSRIVTFRVEKQLKTPRFL